jgi:uncharacterized DUF497 family protein
MYTQKAVFEWDHGKAATNVAKHGVSFEEASTVFNDSAGLDGSDLAHSSDELRRLRLAASTRGRILVVAYTMRWRGNEEVIITRIISARPANRRERARYGSSQD